MQIRSKNLDSHEGKEACVYTEHNKVSLIQGGTNKQNDACSSEHIVLWCAQEAFFPYLWGPGPPVLASIAAESRSKLPRRIGEEESESMQGLIRFFIQIAGASSSFSRVLECE